MIFQGPLEFHRCPREPRSCGRQLLPPLNRVARLLAVGHDGQTLLSKIVHALYGDRISAGAALGSLVEHGLKDLIRRETVFQLCHPDLPQAFPPLKTLH